MTRNLRTATFGALLLALPFFATGNALADSNRRVGQVAYQNAQAITQTRGGGILSHTWHVTKGTVLAGACGFGVGYLLGGPGMAINIGARAAGGGAMWRSFETGQSRLYLPSERAFAKSCLAEIDGHGFKKQMCKAKGIVLSGLETGASNALFLGGLGALFGGPAGIVANATAGFVGGTIFGVGAGICRAYIAPAFRNFSMNRALGKAEKALDKLERDPSNNRLQVQAQERLGKVLVKSNNIPLLSEKQTARFDLLRARAGGHSNLSQIAAALQ
jgi:hypothetical protein